ncbi:MAG TPA: PAS domain-containing hybrid sensor histidine kinase/response regulator, partial [Candidatus Hydrogenedentes bacterium]|nr:PAS domain-containing hybrid sensor histidine kinase/response regulator [Candidatus Hydrogenedentota bacterium]
AFPCTVLLNKMTLGDRTILEATVRDITERKRAQEALIESETRLNKLIGVAQDAIIMMDADGNISMWNESAERIFDYAASEALGRNLHKLLAPERFWDAFQAGFTEFEKTGTGNVVGRVLELDALRKTGDEFPVELSLSAVQLKGRWHAIGILRDISARKQAEAALQETLYHLEEATARANEMAAKAEIASMAKSQFLANMSHEIRTPMNGVIGAIDLLLDTNLNNEQRHFAEIVRSSGESLLTLIDDILDYSKIEAGKLDLETLDFDLRALLDDFAAMLATRAQDKGLEFVCAADPQVPAHLQGDPGRLRQVLINLTGNAIKFTHQGEVAVRAYLESETDTEAVLRFSIKDTGIGIPEDKIDILFDKFTQVDASTTRKYGGTGLGLAISKQLVEMMGGRIGVSSKEGVGSEFWFTARFIKQPEPKRIEAPPMTLRGAHVLVVDDNATNREIMAAQCAAWGVRAEQTSDGPTALRMLHQAREAGDTFAVVIMDMQMPEMDGEALGRAIKADKSLKDTLMVMMTSLGQRGDTRRLEAIGFSGYLTKPVRQSDLFDCLAMTIAGAAQEEKAQTIVTRHAIREMRRRSARILLAEDNI